MKKFVITLTCLLACLALFSGCAERKGNDEQDRDNSVEIDILDGTDSVDDPISTDDPTGTGTLPEGFTYSFRDPDNSDGIVITPRE